MTQIKQSRAQMEKRRDEINAQLNKVNADERIELDNDMEEQAIEVEQHEVSVTMEENLQRELTQIEDQLAAMNGEN